MQRAPPVPRPCSRAAGGRGARSTSDRHRLGDISIFTTCTWKATQCFVLRVLGEGSASPSVYFTRHTTGKGKPKQHAGERRELRAGGTGSGAGPGGLSPRRRHTEYMEVGSVLGFCWFFFFCTTLCPRCITPTVTESDRRRVRYFTVGKDGW